MDTKTCHALDIGEQEYHGLTVRIEQDMDPLNPLEDWDVFGTLVCWHRRYDLGHKNGVEKLQEAVRSSKRFQQYPSWGDYSSDHYKDLSDPATLINTAAQCGILMLELYLYDHGGITMRTSKFSCPWDSGQVGVIFITTEDAKEELGVPRLTKKAKEKAYECMKGTVESYDQYLTGDVYGYTIEDEDGEYLESCWGFFGSDYVCEEAKAVADSILKHFEETARAEAEHQRVQHLRKAKDLIKNHVPLDVRQRVLADYEVPHG